MNHSSIAYESGHGAIESTNVDHSPAGAPELPEISKTIESVFEFPFNGEPQLFDEYDGWWLEATPRIYARASRFTNDFSKSMTVKLNEDKKLIEITIEHLNPDYANSFTENQLEALTAKGYDLHSYWQNAHGRVAITAKEQLPIDKFFKDPEWRASAKFTSNGKDFTVWLGGYED